MLEKEVRIRGFENHELNLNIYTPEKSEADLVVLGIHGFGEYGSRYRNWAKYFVDKNCAFYIYDQRGHGLTQGPRGVVSSYEVFLADMDHVLMEIKKEHEGKPIVLYGHSMGGNIALNYLLRKKGADIGLGIISSPWLKLYKEPPLFSVRLLERLLGSDFIIKARLGRLTRDEDYFREVNHRGLYHRQISAGMTRGVMEAGIYALENPDLITVPTLLLSGGNDLVVNIDAIDRFVSSGNNLIYHIRWDDAFHELHNDLVRDEVFNVIWNFIVSNIK